jgi:hypothetical protein
MIRKRIFVFGLGMMCLCLMTSCQTKQGVDFDSFNRRLISQIENKETTDEMLLQSISRLGKVSEPPTFWTTIANDKTYSIEHRSRCIMALFRRHAQRCSGGRQLSKVLAPVHWLESKDIGRIDVLAGAVPVTPGTDRTVFVIRVLSGAKFAIYISILGKMDTEDFYRMICDANGKYNAVVLEYGYADDYDEWLLDSSRQVSVRR